MSRIANDEQSFCNRLVTFGEHSKISYESDAKRLPDGPIKSQLSGPVHSIAMEYFDEVDGEFTPAFVSGDSKRADRSRAKLLEIATRHKAAVEELVKTADEYDKALEARASDSVRTGTWMMTAVAVGSTLLIVFAGWIIGRAVSNPLKNIVARLKDISEGEGDLTKTVDVYGSDEVAQVASYFNKFVSKLRDMIGSISENAQHVATASEQLSASSQQITANSEETSAQATVVSEAGEHVNQNLHTIATGAEQMSATINEIAKNEPKLRPWRPKPYRKRRPRTRSSANGAARALRLEKLSM